MLGLILPELCQHQLICWKVLNPSTTASSVCIYSLHSGAITGTGYGIWAEKTGASTTNVGGYFSSSGGTNNYALITGGGNVGINTTTPADCAILDVTSTDKGILIPRVILTNVTTYAPVTGTAVDGLMVYSRTTPTGGTGTGFYYWSIADSKWIKVYDTHSGSGGFSFLCSHPSTN